MPSEPERDSNDTAAVLERARAERKKKKRPKPPIPRTEKEIDAPDHVTLFMLGVLCVLTLVLWGFARGGCNYHPPRETKRPRAVKTEELARDPKDAALEMQQRLVQLDFDGALELAADAAEAEVKKQKADCEKRAQACAEDRKKLERTAPVAVLLERDMGVATARATSHLPDGKKVTNILRLERRGPMWKVVSTAPDDGSFQPKEKPEMPPGHGTLVPSASGSAAPAGSAPPGASAPPSPLRMRPPAAPSATP